MRQLEILLAWQNGIIKELFERESEYLIREKYSEKREKEILRNLITDTESAVTYLRDIREIRISVKNEIETVLNQSIDLGFDETMSTEGLLDTADSLTSAVSTILGSAKTSLDLQSAEQFRRGMQLFAKTLSEETALEIPLMYDAWEPGMSYDVGIFVRYGTNGVGDAQLYKVVQAHRSQDDWTPDKTPALYVAVGLTQEGFPVWSRPTGAHDAYAKGDIVDYNGSLYKSTIDGNVYSPDEYSGGWTPYVQ